LDVPEVTQSEEGQKQKLGIVLTATNRVSSSIRTHLIGKRLTSILLVHRAGWYSINALN
jgi:hypothetical protein